MQHTEHTATNSFNGNTAANHAGRAFMCYMHNIYIYVQAILYLSQKLIQRYQKRILVEVHVLQWINNL